MSQKDTVLRNSNKTEKKSFWVKYQVVFLSIKRFLHAISIFTMCYFNWCYDCIMVWYDLSGSPKKERGITGTKHSGAPVHSSLKGLSNILTIKLILCSSWSQARHTCIAGKQPEGPGNDWLSHLDWSRLLQSTMKSWAQAPLWLGLYQPAAEYRDPEGKFCGYSPARRAKPWYLPKNQAQWRQKGSGYVQAHSPPTPATPISSLSPSLSPPRASAAARSVRSWPQLGGTATCPSPSLLQPRFPDLA